MSGAADNIKHAAASPSGDEDISFLSLAIVVAHNLRLLVLGSLTGGLITLGITFLVTPIFTARTSFLPPNQQQGASAAALAQLGTLAGVVSSASGLKNPVDQYVALLKSQSVADRVIDRHQLISLYGVDLRQDAREELEENTKVTAGKDGLVVVEVDDESPQRAADIANSYVSELQVLLGRLALTEAQQRRVFFEKQLAETKNNLAEAERALTASGVTPSAMKANPEAAVEVVATLQAKVSAQEIKLAAMRGYLTESAPEFLQAQVELAALRAQLRRQEASDPSASTGGDYIDRFRVFKYHEALFELFARQYELAKVDEAREGAAVQVVDTAMPPERKSKPKRALIAALGALAIGFALLITAITRHAMRTGTQNPLIAPKLVELKRLFLRAIGRV